MTVAQNHYFPEWWEGWGPNHNLISLGKWNELPRPVWPRGGNPRVRAMLAPTAVGGARRLFARDRRPPVWAPPDAGCRLSAPGAVC
jgi:hypothetical protein